MVLCMCINTITIHSTTFYSHSSTLVPPFLCTNFCPSPRPPLLGPYTGEFLGHSHPIPLSQLEHISTGTTLPPVPTFLVEKLESGAFIEMGDLIPTHLGLDDTARSKLRRSVTNISEWLQAFAVYVSVIAKKQPHCVPDLMGYQLLILEAGNKYRNDC